MTSDAIAHLSAARRTGAEEMMMADEKRDPLAAYINERGELDAYAWPGGYPLYYLTSDSGEVCAACATLFTRNPEDWNPDQCTVIGAQIHWEGAPLICDHCYKAIESAYGDPDADQEA